MIDRGYVGNDVTNVVSAEQFACLEDLMRIIVHRFPRYTTWMVVSVVVAFVGMLPAVALAQSLPKTTVLATGEFENTVHLNNDRIKFQTKDVTDVRFRKVEFHAGDSSGWRHQTGIVIVTVASGAVTVWDSQCNKTTYGPGLPDGAVFVEGGDDPGQVTSDNGAINYAVQVVPDANPPLYRIDDPTPPCAQ